MKIYLAGPLFTTAERLFNQELARRLRASGHEVWLPQEHDEVVLEHVFQSCVEGILWSEVVVACTDGPDPDSGTCAECGFAFEKRPIVAYRTDFRAGGDGGSWNYNLVLGGMATVRLDAVHAGKLGDPIDDLSQAICASLELAEIESFARRTRALEEIENELVLWAVAPDADRAFDSIVAGEGFSHLVDFPELEEGERLYQVQMLVKSVDPTTISRRKS